MVRQVAILVDFYEGCGTVHGIVRKRGLECVVALLAVGKHVAFGGCSHQRFFVLW
jgi:hypothetical protein